MTNGERLQEMLGFDPVGKAGLTQDLFSEVVKEIQEERTKEAKAKAKEYLIKAMQLREQMEKAKRDFDTQYKKFEKELGKVLNQIQGILTGKEEGEEVG
jgi:DNA replication protein DnaD